VGGDGWSPLNYGAGQAPGLQWLADAKLGMFMHWGPVAQWGTEISFPLLCASLPCTVRTAGNAALRINTTAQLAAHRQSYRDLATTWNPASFNATAMAQLAKAAGFKYLMFTTVHCDGFANWPSNATAYNVMNTPFARDAFGELAAAYRREGLRVGAYVCPSLWNNDEYWAPDALRATGPCCAPNYDPQSGAAPDAARWARYVSFLHRLLHELVDGFAPDAFWVDCSNSPPRTDTRIEALLGAIRAANPQALVMTRGGVFSDYVDLTDQSEAQAAAIMGQPAMDAGTLFEVGTVLQASRQWAFDPASAQKPASAIIGNLAQIAAKGGNYLVNVAPGPSGLWAPAAVGVLEDMAAWFAHGAEAVHDTRPMYPFQWGSGIFFTSRSASGGGGAAGGSGAVYAIVPAVAAAAAATATSATVAADGSDGRSRSRGQARPLASPPTSAEQPMVRSAVHAEIAARAAAGAPSELLLVPLRKDVLGTAPSDVELLGAPAGAVSGFHVSDAGLAINFTIPPLPPVPVAMSSLWCAANNDTAPSMASGTPRPPSYWEGAGYVKRRVEATVSATQGTGMVALSLAFDDALVDNTLAPHGHLPAGYSDIEPECYVFASADADGAGGAVEVWRSAAREDQWIIGSDASRAEAAAEGYEKQRTLGYGLAAQHKGATVREVPNAIALAFKVSFGAAA
jgi:alpha-L-fucosidase